MFDRDRELASWRARLLAGGQLRERDAEELEDHLREASAALEGLGLAPDEAFLIASRRLGAVGGLRDEFGKLDAARPWIRRACWMLVGYVAVVLLLQFARLASEVAGLSALAAGGGPGLSGLLAVAVALAVPLFVLLAVGRCLRAAPDRWERALERARNRAAHPAGSALIVVGTLAAGLLVVLGRESLVLLQARMLTMQDFGSLSTARAAVALAGPTLVPLAAAAWLAWSLRRERRAETD